MAKEAIEKIRLAEEEADALRSNARAQARAMQDAAEAEGRAELEKTEKACKQQYREGMDAAQKKADEMLREGRRIAAGEAEALRDAAEKNCLVAVEELLGGIGAKCQSFR